MLETISFPESMEGISGRCQSGQDVVFPIDYGGATGSEPSMSMCASSV